MSEQFRPTYVDIHLDHLKKNLGFFSQSPLAQHFLCPMVKANAYGHGDLKIVKALESMGCRTFGVGLVEEGIHLREAGRALSEILVFGFCGYESVREMAHHNLTPVVSDWDQLQILSENSDQPLQLHLKFNSGMHRLGFPLEEAEKVLEFVRARPHWKLLGIGTHLMTSEALVEEEPESYEQLTRFRETFLDLKVPKNCKWHAYNTEGALRSMDSEFFRKKFPYGYRIGLGLYGLSLPDSPAHEKLLPVMSLKSKVVSVQKVKKGQSVSYGATWTAGKDSLVGIVPVGYADGIPTQLSNKGFVRIDEELVPVVGRVCMDYTLVDVSKIKTPLMKTVEFFGENISAHEVGQRAGTITYDVLTRISERVPRVFREATTP